MKEIKQNDYCLLPFLIIIGVKSNKTNYIKYISFISTNSVTYYSILYEVIAMYEIGVPAESRIFL